jgi:hypothetical protein
VLKLFAESTSTSAIRILFQLFAYFCAVQEQTIAKHWPARIISILFHPVFVPTMVFAFLIYLSPDIFYGVSEKTRQWWLIMVAYITITFPLLVVFLLWRLKFIESMEMHGLKERYGPMMASMLFYFWTFWMFHKQFDPPLLVQSFLLGVFLASALLFIFGIFVKISLHAGAWGGVVAFSIIAASHQIAHGMIMVIASLLIAGLVGSSRLALNAHSTKQVYVAYLLGAFAQILALLICKILL